MNPFLHSYHEHFALPHQSVVEVVGKGPGADVLNAERIVVDY